MSIKKKVLLSIVIVLLILGGLSYLALTSLFGGGGPSPRLVLVVSSETYEVGQILEAIDNIEGGLEPRIDKHDDSTPHNYFFYKHAFWYPQNGSDVYGIAIVEWDTSSWDNDEQQMGGRFFIDVYSESTSCVLCPLVKTVLSEARVEYSSPCENPKGLTDYEKIRCDI